jgi:thiol-disulfide isomerase/thioredoxin
LAGLASVGALGGAGAVATGSVPGALGGGASEAIEPVTIRTIDAPGSRDGEVTIPADRRPTFVDFFGTYCSPCIEQMPDLGEAADHVGDEVLFVSVTNEDVGGAMPEEQLVNWWEEHDGDWLVAADVTAALAGKFSISGYPTAIVLDASGRVTWRESGKHTADEIVAGIETAIDR